MIAPINKDDLRKWEHPKSYFTKQIVIDSAIKHGCKQSSIDMLRVMSRDDVLSTCLKQTCYCYCGSVTDPHRGGYCRYYEIDYDFIDSLT